MFKKLRLGYMIIFLYLLTIGLVYIVSSVIIGESVKKVSVEMASNSTLKMLRQVSKYGEMELKRLSYMVYSVSSNREILTIANNISECEYCKSDKVLKIRTLREKITDYFSFSGSMLSVVFYMEDGSSFYINNIPEPDINSVKGHDWYQNVINDKGIVYNISYTDGLITSPASSSYLSMAISPRKTYLDHNVEMIYYIFSGDMFRSIHMDISPSKDSEFIILDRSGKLFAISKASSGYGIQAENLWKDNRFIDSSGYFTDYSNGKKVIITYSMSPSGQWIYVNFDNYDNLTAGLDNKLNIQFLLNSLFCVIIALFAIYLILHTTKPLSLLARHMKKVEMGNLNMQIDIGGFKEISMLGESFNSMKSRINHLIDELKEANINRTQAEISALQAQINPHFLLNTLNTIKLMLILSDKQSDDRIINMLTSLMNMLDGVLTNADSMISVHNEIEFLKSYTHIMQTRFDMSFKVIYDIDQQVASCRILKFLLQPILENAINHGIHAVNNGEIEISAYSDGNDIEFLIKDNGIGMAQEQADQIIQTALSYKKTFNHMGGITNVIQRIHLNYGENYGLNIKSAIGAGTLVILRIPRISSLTEEIYNEKDIDC